MRYAKVERTIAGRVLSLETGRIAKQAGGSVVAAYGDTVVLAAVCTAGARPGIDFFPLSVEYREKTYAAGKFPGGFIKREGRPKDKEILTSRLIDRPLRPLWPEGYNDEVQVIATVVSADKENDPDTVAMNGAFAAAFLAPIPFQGPIAAVRVGRVGEQWVAFPTVQQMDEGDVDLVLAASRDALVMVEGQAQELKEEDFLAALDFGHGVIRQILDMMEELREKAAPPECTWQPPEVEIPREYHRVKDEYADRMREAVLVQGKHDRYAAIAEVKKAAIEDLVDAGRDDADGLKKWVGKALHELESEVMRALILDEGKRIDLRSLKDVRKITIETGVLPRTHGSALFTRGETQALVITTLGTPRDQQIVDGLMDEYAKRFDLQYNFPPFSVGEVKPMRGTGRREIGHGNLAERALAPVIPPDDKFPYTIRLVSEITESNGSSSMATVCGGTLALMDAGVPIRQPVAGIAMGLIKDGDRVAVLTDILGTEDHLGDMDFKVAGTGRGITSVQMDIKVKGLSRAILEKALRQAKEGRLHILRELIKALPKPRGEISKWAPRLLQVMIPVEKIGLVIGPSGKMIKKIQEETGANVEIDDEGRACISSVDSDAAQAAKAMVEQLIAEVEVGRIYQGRVVSIKDFGAFVEVLPGQEGLCHVSELDESHVRSVTDVVSVGDVIPVKVILRDEQGRLKLSRRAALLEGDGPGEVPRAGDRPAGPAPEREDRGGRFERGEPRERGDRPPRRERGDEVRPPRGDRGDRGDRPDRGPRDRFDRGGRGDRPQRDGDREEAPAGIDRPIERGDRSEGRGRFDRPDRPEREDRVGRGARDEAADRGDRPDRGDRGDRGERGERDGRGDRFPRGDRTRDAGDEFRGPRFQERPDRETGSPGVAEPPREPRGRSGRGDRSRPARDDDSGPHGESHGRSPDRGRGGRAGRDDGLIGWDDPEGGPKPADERPSFRGGRENLRDDRGGDIGRGGERGPRGRERAGGFEQGDAAPAPALEPGFEGGDDGRRQDEGEDRSRRRRRRH